MNYEEQCKTLEKENKRLKQQIRILKDKLYDKNCSLNRLYDEGFEKVDLG